MKHLFKLLNIHGLSELLRHSPDVVCVDGSGFIVVKEVEDFVDAVLCKFGNTLDSLSPSLEVMASKNSSKSISRPSLSSSVIMLKIVGFFDSKPRLCIADFSSLNRWYDYLGSILPVASVSNKLKAYLSSSISSSVSPGLSIFFFDGPLPVVFPFIFKFISYFINQI